MKKSLITALSSLLFSHASIAGLPILVTLTGNEFAPGVYYYDVNQTGNGDGAFTPYSNVDIALLPTDSHGKPNIMTVTLGDLGHGLCAAKFNAQTHEFTWLYNKPYTPPYSDKTYACSAHYFEKYQHAFIFIVEVK